MSPTLNGSSMLQRFECGNAIEMYNEVMFDFYPGLDIGIHVDNVMSTCMYASVHP